MQLVTFHNPRGARLGVLDPSRQAVIDLAHAAPGLATDMLSLIALGTRGWEAVAQALASDAERLPLASVQLLAPIPRPARNIICVGKNYREHVQEVERAWAPAPPDKHALPEVPIFFTKATTTVIGPGMAIPASTDPTASVDYEGELAVIIGPGGKGITRAQAMQHVYGYTIINDVTSRRLQKQHQQWFLGKSLDGFCPMGPVLMTRDAIADSNVLRIQTWVNDELRQDAGVADMIFDIPSLIATLSQLMTLEAGDIIATGTPAGVGMGFKPPRYLQQGDRVSIVITPIGTLENDVS